MIRAGMTIAEAILQLTKGFRKMMGRDPSGLEQIKIKQEAITRLEDMNKVVDMEGNVIDTSKGIMGGKQIQDSPEFGKRIKEKYDAAKGPGKGQEMVDAMKSPGARKSYKIIEDQLGVKLYGDESFEEILQIQKTGKHPRGEPKRSMVKDAVDNASPGFVKGDRKYNAQLVAEDLAEKKFGKEFYDLDQKQQIDLYDEALKGLSEDMAQGGRAGFKEGSKMTRRNFLKIMGGLAAIPIVGKFFKLAKVGKTVTKVPIIKTGDVPGKPEWFDALVNKVILEGDDVTKRFATQERQVIHMKKIDDDTSVTVTQDLNDGSIMVDVDDPIRNVMGETGQDTSVQMILKKGQADETTKGTPPDEFSFTENDMRNYMDGPDDYTTEFAENTVNKMSDLTSDLGKIKSYATGKKPTMKQIVESKKRQDMVELAERNPAEYAAGRGPEFDPDYDDFASGGIARMLGE